MRVKLLIALLITLVAMSMFATSTRTSASPDNRPRLSYTPEPNISIDMYELRGNGFRTETQCVPSSTKFGCTAFCDNSEDEYKEWCKSGEPIEPYPYGSESIIVPVQTYYLLDVVAVEMNPSPSWMPIPAALRAQAIAARSYAWYQYEFSKPLNNSNSFQVYVPYQFDKLNLKAAPMEPKISTPCDPYRFRNESQEMTCDAIAPQYYLSSWNDDLPTFSEFSADVAERTNASSDPQFPYLASVEDPISTACDASNDGHGRGMSQWGAARWALGDQCALAGNGSDTWSVVWTRAEQTLFHYFTGVQLRDANDNKRIVSPDWRWNPLDIRWENVPNYQPPIFHPGNAYPVTFQLQNTGVEDWICQQNGPIPPPGESHFYLRYRWLPPQGIGITSPNQIEICSLTTGQSRELAFTIADVPNWATGNYILRFDVYDSSGNFWFSSDGWPPYDIPVRIELPPMPTPTLTPTPYY